MRGIAAVAPGGSTPDRVRRLYDRCASSSPLVGGILSAATSLESVVSYDSFTRFTLHAEFSIGASRELKIQLRIFKPCRTFEALQFVLGKNRSINTRVLKCIRLSLTQLAV
jgi:hypothetical protein